MAQLLRPSLGRLFHIGMFDFYAFLVLVVALVLQAPDNVMTGLGLALATIFGLSACETLSGMLLNRLYREPESYTIFILQLVFTIGLTSIFVL